jgi:hypothetical protein
MQYQRFMTIVIIFFLSVMVIGCEKPDPEFERFGRDSKGNPLEYRYISSSIVELRMNHQVYRLKRYGEPVQAPFRYQFEDDGDLDVVINGRVYDIDSPYDIDIKTSKKKKQKTKKKKLPRKTKKIKKKPSKSKQTSKKQ